jgi:hypothetical protein
MITRPFALVGLIAWALLAAACGGDLNSESMAGNEQEGSGGTDTGKSPSGGTSGSSGSLGTGAAVGTGATSSGVGGTASGGGSGGSGSGGSAGTSAPTDSPSDPGASTGGSSSMPVPLPGNGNGGLQAGTLTAGAWDDNLNFDFFLAYRKRMDVLASPGLLPVDEAEYRAAHALFAQTGGPKQTLDVALVIDTTGSMGDEMQYLQTEFIELSARIADRHPNAEQHWSLVLYRDEGDAYVVRSYDFTTDIEQFQQDLGTQDAGGGGDIPEAPDQALLAATELAWRTDDDTAKLAFWVADAPPHLENAERMATAIRDIGALGVHVFPVASSGIDEITELTMRSAAQMTGGRYLFLTDDSGVGGPHKEPTIPCYFVTRLDHAIERMVDIELSGEYREPEASEIIRTGGDPERGACSLDSGDEVLVY